MVQGLPVGSSVSFKKIPGLLHPRPALKYAGHTSECPSFHIASAQGKARAGLSCSVGGRLLDRWG